MYPQVLAVNYDTRYGRIARVELVPGTLRFYVAGGDGIGARKRASAFLADYTGPRAQTIEIVGAD